MYFRLPLIIFLICTINSACVEKNNHKIKQSRGQLSNVKTEIEQIQWIYSLSDGLKLAQEKNKLLMVYFYANWCSQCKKLDRDTYIDPEVIKLSYDFISVKVNTDENPDDTKTYKVIGPPTIVFLNSKGEIIEKVIGYRESKDLISIMKKVLGR